MLKSIIVKTLAESIKLKRKNILKECSFRSCSIKISKTYKPFMAMINKRRNEAKNSVMIRKTNDQSVDDILGLCSTFGDIKFAALHTKEKDSFAGNLLIEFKNEASVHMLLQKVKESSGGNLTKLNIPFLCLTGKINRKIKVKIPYVVECEPYEEDIDKECGKQKSFSDEIKYFYDSMKLTDIGSRLRFLCCRKMELSGPLLMAPYDIFPFGSSINSFGRFDCDIDMVIHNHNYNVEMEDELDQNLNKSKEKFPLSYSRFTRHYIEKEESVTLLKLVFSTMTVGLYTFEEPQRIFGAKVPIIKCREQFTDFHCDVSCGNMDGVHMSEVLYILGRYDPRVRPLVFYIRKWAKDTNIATAANSRRILSNFATTCLVLFYLMKCSVIPPICRLEMMLDQKCDSNDEFPKSLNTQSLSELFRNFFKFYTEFSYAKGISLIQGDTFNPAYHYALYIENPINTSLNITKNTSAEDLDIFTEYCTNTLHAITSLCKRKRMNEQLSWLDCIVHNLGTTKYSPNNKINVDKLESTKYSNDVTFLLDPKKLNDRMKKKLVTKLPYAGRNK